MELEYHVTIIGGGIVGCALANVLSKRYSTLLLERNHDVGLEVSSRSSEVIHTSINYPSGLKGELCQQGNPYLYEICAKYGIPHKKLGKLILAKEGEEETLEALYNNAISRGLEMYLLDKGDLKKKEPHVNAVAAIWSPQTGIVDSHSLIHHYKNSSTADFVMKANVVGMEKIPGGYTVLVDNDGKHAEVTTESLINAAGLQADIIAKMCGVDDSEYTLHYCKGDYFSVGNGKNKMFNHLIYPLPGPVSQGIHVKVELDGRVKIGPDAEYIPREDLNYKVDESKKEMFYRYTQRYFPFVTRDDLAPETSGVRPKLQKKGGSSRDWIIREEKERGLPRLINLIGIDSTGITSSPAIPKYVEKMYF